MPKTNFCGYICGIMTTYQQILIILDNFEINFIGALFPPETAVVWSTPRVRGGASPAYSAVPKSQELGSPTKMDFPTTFFFFWGGGGRKVGH